MNITAAVVERQGGPFELRELELDLWRRGALPVERMIQVYDFEDIDRAAHDAESGEVIKPVLRIGRE